MRPRAPRLLFWTLLLAAAALALLLWQLRERAERRLGAAPTSAAAAPPPQGDPTSVTFMVANDADGSLLEQHRTLVLPEDTSARARALLNQLIVGYAQPGSAHPIAVDPGVDTPGVDTVFLLPLPRPTGNTPMPEGTLAVVNLSGAFAQAHPSGIAPETLTLLSLIATLHANLPAIAEVRFLVDGAPRDTLAGHADLTHTYLASSSAAPVPEAPAAAAPQSGTQFGTQFGTQDGARP